MRVLEGDGRVSLMLSAVRAGKVRRIAIVRPILRS